MKGIRAVGGMAMAKIFLVEEDTPEIVKIFIDDYENEYKRLLTAKEISTLQLEKIMKATTEKLGQENGEIFDYQLLMLEDKAFCMQSENIL